MFAFIRRFHHKEGILNPMLVLVKVNEDNLPLQLEGVLYIHS